MRRRIRMILIAALVLALAVPFGTALTLERRPLSPGPVAVSIQTPGGNVAPLAAHPAAESAMLLLTGCLLIALGAAVRRTS